MANDTNIRNVNAEINEKLFDAMLKIAAEEIIKEEMEAMPSCEELNALHPPSAELDKRIRAIIAKESHPFKTRRIMRQFSKIAAVFGFVFTISAVMLMSIEASRNHILNIFIGIQNDHVVFEFGQEDTGTQVGNGEDENIGNILIGYIPDGFVLMNSQMFEDFSIVIYENLDGGKLIIQRESATILSAAMDRELRNYSTIFFNGREAYLFEALDDSELNVIMWQYENDVMFIDSNIDIETLLLVAKNISLN